MNEYDFYDFAYDDGWYDVLAGNFNGYRYDKDFGYADGVDDADYYLWKKHRDMKAIYVY